VGLVGPSSAGSAGSVPVVPIVPAVVPPPVSAASTAASASPASRPLRHPSTGRGPLSLAEQFPILMAEARAMSWGQRRERRAKLEMELSAISWAESQDMLEEEKRGAEEDWVVAGIT
jgi:hypothetical protein